MKGWCLVDNEREADPLEAKARAAIGVALAKVRGALAQTENIPWPPKERSQFLEGLARDLQRCQELRLPSERGLGLDLGPPNSEGAAVQVHQA